MSRSAFADRFLPLALLLFALAAHFTGYIAYPLGVGGDAARLAIHTLDFLQRAVWPFYIYHLDAPNPLIIFLQAPLFAAFGFNPAILRGLTTFAGALASPATYLACRELFADGDPRFARRVGIIAAVSLALLPFFNIFVRYGTEHALLPVLALLTAAALWRGFRRKRWTDFFLAGLVLGLSQYSYIVARGFAVALAAACIVALLSSQRVRAAWRGLALTVITSIIVIIPQLILFISAPHTFTARAQQSAGQFVFSLPNPAQITAAKLLNQILMLGWHWDTGYNPFSGRPILNPVLFVGLLVAVVAALRSRDVALRFSLTTAAFMLVPDLIAYEGLSPSATRISSAVPFIFVLAAAGCAMLWGWLERRWRPTGWLVFALVLAAGAEGQWDLHRRVIPQANAADGLEWKATLVEVAEAEYIAAHLDRPILISSSEYQRPPLAFLLVDHFPNRAGGVAAPLVAGGVVTVIEPTAPDRPTIDGPPAGYIPDQWVLLKNGTAYFLPPLPGGIELMGNPESITASNGVMAASAFPARWIGLQPSFTPVMASFSNGLDLTGYHAAEIAAGQPVTVTLYWRSRQQLPADVQLFTQILDRNGNAIAAIHDWPFHGVYRAQAWLPGEVVPLSYTLMIPPDTLPGQYHLVAGVFDIIHQDRVRLLTGEDVATVATLKLPLMPTDAQPAQSLSADFGDTIHLSGYTLNVATGEMRLSLFWQASKPPDADYTVFVHVVDANGNIAAQSDSQPLNNQYPTSIWSAGETIVDERTIPAASGTYHLFVGLYRWDTGERLPALLNGERLAEDRVLLGNVTVP